MLYTIPGYIHTLLHTTYPAREGMRVWGMEHPR